MSIRSYTPPCSFSLPLPGSEPVAGSPSSSVASSVTFLGLFSRPAFFDVLIDDPSLDFFNFFFFFLSTVAVRSDSDAISTESRDELCAHKEGWPLPHPSVFSTGFFNGNTAVDCDHRPLPIKVIDLSRNWPEGPIESSFERWRKPVEGDDGEAVGLCLCSPWGWDMDRVLPSFFSSAELEKNAFGEAEEAQRSRSSLFFSSSAAGFSASSSSTSPDSTREASFKNPELSEEDRLCGEDSGEVGVVSIPSSFRVFLRLFLFRCTLGAEPDRSREDDDSGT